MAGLGSMPEFYCWLPNVVKRPFPFPFRSVAAYNRRMHDRQNIIDDPAGRIPFNGKHTVIYLAILAALAIVLVILSR